MANTLPDPARVRAIALRLTSWPSETGTAGEALFGERLRDLLLEIPYFRDHPQDVVLLDSHGEPPRRNVVAMVRGRGRRALALAGHYDTASIANYQELADLACAPEPLMQALLADLRSRPLSDQEAKALADFESGDFVPGRGLLDMKSGLAVAIAMLERFAADPHREGNLILLASPDEERESRGARSLRDALPKVMATRGLSLEGAINLDVTSDQEDGSRGRCVFEGTIGKLLPFAYVIGQPSHAAYPFEGVSAPLIAAEIVRAIEGNTALADHGKGTVSPPPICLEIRDTRAVYEVTTPEHVWVSFNWLYHSGRAEERFALFRRMVDDAMLQAVERFKQQASAFASATHTSAGAGMAATRIVTLGELRRMVLTDAGKAQAYSAFEESLAQIDNPLVLSRRLTQWLADEARLTGPTVVIGFAGLHYPPTRVDENDPRGAALMRAVAVGEAAVATEAGTRLCRMAIFQGISDMSFLGQPAHAGSEVVAENTPAARLIDRPAPDALEFPIVNIGPWGREFHQRLERLHAPFAFAVLPKVIAAIVDEFLRDAAR